jgi:hypothetical protein
MLQWARFRSKQNQKSGLLFAKEVPQGVLMSKFFIFLTLSVAQPLRLQKTNPSCMPCLFAIRILQNIQVGQ